ncbi:DUF1330 domain-containing protein [Microbulbifer sp. JMSA004]|uniref:DUF1330 domain-containing protein n=1 Tax=unclassified Microbulbifer TaxID=2619833 RepID=UPI0024AD602B|nr:DUF1330 domain-containing protein [Microbulbifer sp. VAAF005]WHI46984.1 DUF1330 domain-containing protein [Microbulbifer sp. VAAF005]
MIHLFMHANVKDYNEWHRVLEEFMPTLEKMGATATSVYREIDNHHNVTVIHEFPSKEEAINFVNSDELQEARKKAGVLVTPKIWYTEKL